MDTEIENQRNAHDLAREMDAGRKFYLLNKDQLLARFHIEGEGLLETIEIDEQFVEMPKWILNLGNFIRNRRAPKKRENIAKLLEMSGCHTLYGWLSITHALSLIDTYWVKPIDSDLTWKKVSLYTHEFNEVIATLSPLPRRSMGRMEHLPSAGCGKMASLN